MSAGSTALIFDEKMYDLNIKSPLLTKQLEKVKMHYLDDDNQIMERGKMGCSESFSDND
jgi:hypothetical protein